jgi:hypothetical protein
MMMTLKLKIIIDNKIWNAIIFDIMLIACCIHFVESWKHYNCDAH